MAPVTSPRSSRFQARPIGAAPRSVRAVLQALALFVVAPLAAAAQGAQPEGRVAPAPAGDYVITFHLPEGGGPGFGFGVMASDRTRFVIRARGEWEREERETALPDVTVRTTSWHVEAGPELRVYGLMNRRVLPFFHLAGFGGLGELGDGTTTRTAGAEIGVGAEWFPFQGVGISGQTGVRGSWSRSEPEEGGPRTTLVRATLFRSELSLNLYY